MAYPLAFRRLVVAAYLRGEGSFADLADAYEIGSRTLQDWVHRARRRGVLVPPRSPGRPRTLDAEAVALLRDLVAADNDATLPALVRALAQRQGLTVSRQTVGRTLQRLDVTRKKSRATTRHVAAHASRGCAAGSSHASPASTQGASFSSTNSASISR
jgi:transposase